MYLKETGNDLPKITQLNFNKGRTQIDFLFSSKMILNNLGYVNELSFTTVFLWEPLGSFSIIRSRNITNWMLFINYKIYYGLMSYLLDCQK